MAIIIICVIVAIIAYLQFTKNGKQIKNVASGTVTEKIKENAMTPEGARARYNTAIKEKQDFYKKTMGGTYTTVAGRLATMEDDLKETKEEISKTEAMINQYIDNHDDKKQCIMLKISHAKGTEISVRKENPRVAIHKR